MTCNQYLGFRKFLGIGEFRFPEVFYMSLVGSKPEFSLKFGKFCNICKYRRLGCFIFWEGTVHVLLNDKLKGIWICVNQKRNLRYPINFYFSSGKFRFNIGLRKLTNSKFSIIVQWRFGGMCRGSCKIWLV